MDYDIEGNMEGTGKSQVCDFADYIRHFARLHEQVKEALERKQDVSAMKLLEQCQAVACELGGRLEAVKGKGCGEVAILHDYCELVYEVNEQIWYKEHVNPGKVYRYLNKCLVNLQPVPK